jgi:Uma2 family endonuclease
MAVFGHGDLAMATASIPAAAITESDALYEVINGEIKEIAPMGVYEGLIATILTTALQSFVAKKLGRVATEVLFDFTSAVGKKRRPDLAFVSFTRWPREKPAPRTESWEVVPDLVVEVISPTNPANEVVDKVAEYFDAGVDRVWVVYPSQRQIYVYASPTELKILTESDQLTDDVLLPGFQLPLHTLFDDAVGG